MPRLHFFQAEMEVPPFELPEGSTTVGRSSRNALVLHDPSVSADHCELIVNWNEVIVRDHGSSNGTWVGGERVSGQRPANHGDLLRFGRVEVRLELDAPPGDDATAVTANFGPSRTAQPRPVPEPVQMIVGSRTPSPEAGEATAFLPVPPEKAPTPAVGPTSPNFPKPTPIAGRAGRGWVKWVLAIAALGAVLWLMAKRL
ncbi:MAG: FHA domain-containing protein [Verrucomicrobiales bacterium]|nr:FHA domain-containing protein [Verrucomicrobiales bacterium]